MKAIPKEKFSEFLRKILYIFSIENEETIVRSYGWLLRESIKLYPDTKEEIINFLTRSSLTEIHKHIISEYLSLKI